MSEGSRHPGLAAYVESIRRALRTLTEREQKALLRVTGEHRAGWRDHVRHFMGSIGTVPDGHQPGAVPAYQVIDGQQRMTTLSILLCVVRDVATAHGWNELASEVEKNYLVH